MQLGPPDEPSCPWPLPGLPPAADCVLVGKFVAVAVFLACPGGIWVGEGGGMGVSVGAAGTGVLVLAGDGVGEGGMSRVEPAAVGVGVSAACVAGGGGA